MKNTFYGIVSGSKKVKEATRTKDRKGRYSVSISEVSKPVDFVITTDARRTIDAKADIEYQAASMGRKLKYFGKFQNA